MEPELMRVFPQAQVRDAWQKLCGRLDAAVLDDLVAMGNVTRLNASDTLIAQGDMSGSVYLVVSGTLDIVKFSMNGHQIWLGKIQSGEIVGEIGALTGAPRTSTISASGPVIVFSMTQSRFQRIMSTHSVVSSVVCKMLAERLQSTSSRIAELVALPVWARLHMELIREGTPRDGDDEVFEIRDPPKVIEFAQRIHASRETTSRAMTELEEKGLLNRESEPWIVLAPRF